MHYVQPSLTPVHFFPPQGFVTSVGNKDRRLRLALQNALPPVVHRTSTTMLAVCMLYISPFEFIVRHFFWLLFAVMCISFVNGMCLFPVLLSIIGPAAELVPLEHPDRISTPSPPAHRSSKRGGGGGNAGNGANKTYVLNNRSSSSSSRSKQPQHHHSKASLTTITEEPQSWKSSNASISTSGPMPGDYGTPNNSHGNNYNGNGGHYKNCNAHHSNYCTNPMQPPPPQQQQQQSGPQQPPSTANLPQQQHLEMKSIVVQPEVTVETTTTGADQNTSTKVTATANIRVELVTPGRAYHFTQS